MQVSKWSPNGEARPLLMKQRLSHASMSIGDAVQIGRELFIAGLAGLVRIQEGTRLLPPASELDEAELDGQDEEDATDDEKDVEENGKKVSNYNSVRSGKRGKGQKGKWKNEDDGGEGGGCGGSRKKGGKGKGKGKGKDAGAGQGKGGNNKS